MDKPLRSFCVKVWELTGQNRIGTLAYFHLRETRFSQNLVIKEELQMYKRTQSYRRLAVPSPITSVGSLSPGQPKIFFRRNQPVYRDRLVLLKMFVIASSSDVPGRVGLCCGPILPEILAGKPGGRNLVLTIVFLDQGSTVIKILPNQFINSYKTRNGVPTRDPWGEG